MLSDGMRGFKFNSNNKYSNPKIFFNARFPIYTFVLMSGYQVSPKEFVIVGLGSQHAEVPNLFSTCVWKSDDGLLVTKGKDAHVDFPGERHGKTYQTIIIQCSFSKLPYFNLKGNLYLGTNKPDAGEVEVFPEPYQLLSESDMNQGFKFEVVLCASPIHDYVNIERLVEWLEYHISVGVDRFVFYLASFKDDRIFEILQSYVDDDLLDVVDVGSILHLDVWYNGQSAFMHDCKLRFQLLSRWMLFLDLDEYLSFGELSKGMATFLQDYQDKPYITFGSLTWSPTICLQVFSSNHVWAIEKLRFHESNPHCLDKLKKQFADPKLCTSHYGHRKYVINPRLVHFLRIHSVIESNLDGLDLSTDVARVNHYHGLITLNNSFCQKVVHRKEDYKTWKYDEELAYHASRVRIVRALNGYEL